MLQRSRRTVAGLAMLAAALAAPASALAVATVQHKKGDVQAAMEPAARAPVGSHQRIEVGTTVSTGPGGYAELHFEDGLVVAMNENTAVKIAAYRYAVAPSARYRDRATLDVLRGAVRVVTGEMAKRSRDSVSVRAPQAELVSGGPSDFTVVLVNPMYVRVAQGNVVAANAAGRTPLPAGSNVEILNGAATPLNIMPSAMPPQAAGPMQSLQTAASTPGGPAPGAASTTASGGAAFGGVPLLGVAAAAAGVAAALGGGSSSTSHH